MVGSQRHSIRITHLETLTDILVHAQDIAIPLADATTCRRRLRPSPPAGCCPCAGRRSRSPSVITLSSSRAYNPRAVLSPRCGKVVKTSTWQKSTSCHRKPWRTVADPSPNALVGVS
jgi:hypothetical protein